MTIIWWLTLKIKERAIKTKKIKTQTFLYMQNQYFKIQKLSYKHAVTN